MSGKNVLSSKQESKTNLKTGTQVVNLVLINAGSTHWFFQFPSVPDSRGCFTEDSEVGGLVTKEHNRPGRRRRQETHTLAPKTQW